MGPSPLPPQFFTEKARWMQVVPGHPVFALFGVGLSSRCRLITARISTQRQAVSHKIGEKLKEWNVIEHEFLIKPPLRVRKRPCFFPISQKLCTKPFRVKVKMILSTMSCASEFQKMHQAPGFSRWWKIQVVIRPSSQGFSIWTQMPLFAPVSHWPTFWRICSIAMTCHMTVATGIETNGVFLAGSIPTVLAGQNNALDSLGTSAIFAREEAMHFLNITKTAMPPGAKPLAPFLNTGVQFWWRSQRSCNMGRGLRLWVANELRNEFATSVHCVFEPLTTGMITLAVTEHNQSDLFRE